MIFKHLLIKKGIKIYYEDENPQVNLNKISEMLKSEPIIENG